MGLDKKCRNMEWKSSYAGCARLIGTRSDHWRGVSAPVGHIALVSLNELPNFPHKHINEM